MSTQDGSQGLYNLFLQDIPSAYLVCQKWVSRSDPHSRERDYTRVWIPGGGDAPWEPSWRLPLPGSPADTWGRECSRRREQPVQRLQGESVLDGFKGQHGATTAGVKPLDWQGTRSERSGGGLEMKSVGIMGRRQASGLGHSTVEGVGRRSSMI